MTPLCRQNDSLLLCVDIQESLFSVMPDPARQKLLENVETLLKTSQRLNIPVFYTEQYPRGLGHTVKRIQKALPDDALYFDKASFSCCGDSELVSAVHKTRKRQLIITGMESHICVMQTALDFLHQGYEVFVVDDAVCSQRMAHWKSALNRLRQAGIIAAPTESILFEWLRDSNHEQFKSVAALLR